MADIKENDFIEEEGVEIVDLDGEPFEIIGELEHEGETYFALIPYSEEDYDEESEEDVEFVILKESDEEDGYFLVTIDDDDFYDKLGQEFLEMFEDEK